MNIELNDEEKEILALIRDFAVNEIKPHAAEIDASGQYPAELVARMSELGIMGLPIPEEYGGAGQSYIIFALAVEELMCGLRHYRPSDGCQRVAGCRANYAVRQ